MKAITSEKTIKSKYFKIKIGTLNKKMPTTMYLEAGTYIKPNKQLSSYKSEIINLEKDLKLRVKEIINKLPAIEKDFILITDVAIDRIDVSRGTHYTIEFSFMPKPNEILDMHKTFGQLADEFVEKYENFFPMFHKIIQSHGFTCSKTK